jgi:cysteinyl-tRNA synthetase
VSFSRTVDGEGAREVAQERSMRSSRHSCSGGISLSADSAPGESRAAAGTGLRWNAAMVFRVTIPFLLSTAILGSCGKGDERGIPSDIDLRQEMRGFVEGISRYAKAHRSNFIIIPQNGIELVTEDGTETGAPSAAYLDAIDGNGQEDLFYGYDDDDQATPAGDTTYLNAFLAVSKNAGNAILVTDYCSTILKMEDSYDRNASLGYISFAADRRDLNGIPAYPSPVHAENDQAIVSLGDAKNFLYLINPGNYPARADFIAAVSATNYDVVVMDLFFDDGTPFAPGEISRLKRKANGAARLVVSYLSIGEAEDYRYYWRSDWNDDEPSWIDGENPDWPGNYKVRYWEKEWQDIIYGNDGSYLKRILDAGFDGAYLDIIDAFEYYE